MWPGPVCTNSLFSAPTTDHPFPVLFLPHGSYVPPGAGPRPSGGAGAGGAAAQGYFSGLRAGTAGDSNGGKAASAVPSRAEISATVKAAARAAAERSGGSGAPAARASKAGGGGGSSGRDKIDRDIFAARPSRGQALGVSAGGYDVYPETGDFETYDSDDVSFVVVVFAVFHGHAFDQIGRKKARGSRG